MKVYHSELNFNLLFEGIPNIFINKYFPACVLTTILRICRQSLAEHTWFSIQATSPGTPPYQLLAPRADTYHSRSFRRFLEASKGKK